MNGKKKVVAYCRVSTLEQKRKGYGIDIQIRDVTIFAERHGLMIEKFYKEEGVSGIREERISLKRLMRDCRSRRISTVIFPSLDRLSREVRIAENIFHEFEKLRIKVMIADMPNYNGERKDILIRQILEAIAEENRKDIIERLYKGRQERVRRGLFPGGNLPYGYRRNNGVVEISLYEASIVRQIYDYFNHDCTGQNIADKLNRQGYKRRNGRGWTQRQVCNILKYEKLYQCGLIRYGKVIGEDNSLVILTEG
jgi:site-specific DNA recombinase